jgi:iron complex outermembrane receptor protein
VQWALFAFERIERNRIGFEAGVRYEYANINPEIKDPESSIGPIDERRFHIWSASVSVLYDWLEWMQVGVNLSRSSRTPTIEELYSRGPHLAAYSYEIGNPQLKDERGIGIECFAYHESPRLVATLNVFRNDLDNYTIHSATGDTNYATFLPIYAAEGVTALLYGAEGEFEFWLGAGFSLGGALNYTYGERSDSGEALPEIPPLKGRASIAYERHNLLLKTEVEAAASQNRLAQFEESTDGYGILNVEAQYQVATHRVFHTFSLHLDNLFDETYRNHLSRVKSVMPEAGRNLRFVYRLMFDL